jgi:hypothetical protein
VNKRAVASHAARREYELSSPLIRDEQLLGWIASKASGGFTSRWNKTAGFVCVFPFVRQTPFVTVVFHVASASLCDL